MTRYQTFVSLSFLSVFSLTFRACAAEATVDFDREIRPILSNHCYKCHGPGTQKAELRLDVREQALAKKAIVVGKSEESKILHRINAEDAERMPPASTGPRLTREQIGKLTTWIQQGAPYSIHWAFVTPKPVVVPSVKQREWTRNPIDAFVLQRPERRGIRPSQQADKVTLIRRVYLDLIGILPTPSEVEAFVNDTSPDAYDRVITRLLESPHFGERQARHWLDMARYADSNGYTIDGKRSIWPYRDWVIDAFNRDLPFDRFTREQLAGDLLPNPTNDQLIATGFQRNTPFNEEGGTDAEQFRVERTIDRTNTVGAVWLGLTVGCAQCHTHKYDPLPQKEYYQLLAFFNSVEEPQLRLTTPEQEQRLESLKAETAKAKGDAEKTKTLQKTTRDFESGLKSTLILRELKTPRPTHVFERGDFLAKKEKVDPGVFSCLSPLDVQGRVPNRLDLAGWLTSPDHPLTSRVFVNRVWEQHFGIGLVETENDFGAQGTVPTNPELLDWLAREFIQRNWSVKDLHRLIVTSATYQQESHHRTDLSERDPRNKLLARQNRIRVEAEIIRDLALSAAGVLAPRVGGPGVFPPQAKELFLFTQSNHGWTESQGMDRYRRALYTFLWRQSQHPLFTTFDGADAQVACTRRNRSNTPLQALHLANDPAFVEIADALGRRIQSEGPPDDAGKLEYGFKVCLGRMPTSVERDRLLQYFTVQSKNGGEKTAWSRVARVLINLDEFITRE